MGPKGRGLGTVLADLVATLEEARRARQELEGRLAEEPPEDLDAILAAYGASPPVLRPAGTRLGRVPPATP